MQAESSGNPQPTAVDEPLERSAPLAARWAESSCRRDPARDCSTYHGAWQYLRLFGMVPSAAQHAEFFDAVLSLLLSNREVTRVLISGTADYAMLARVLYACRRCDVEPEVTVVDLCETPLRLCDWYARRESFAIRTESADILDYEPDEAFDLICTHSLLPRFAEARRRDVAAKWRDLLRPGGRVVTANRLLPGTAQQTLRFTDAQVDRIGQQAFREAKCRGDELGEDAARLAQRARIVAVGMRYHPVGSEADLRALFEGAGLPIERLDRSAQHGAALDHLLAPADGKPMIWAETVAARP